MNPDTNHSAAFAVSSWPQTGSDADSSGVRLGNQKPTVEAEEQNYDSVPPKKTISISVRYLFRGCGQPLPFPLDEEDG